MITVLIMTDGRRDCIEHTIASAAANLRGPVTRWLIHDDSGDPAYRAWLDERYPATERVSTPGRSGFGGAIRSAWAHLTATAAGERYVFHLEDDFTFRREIDLGQMVSLLAAHAHLAQVALLRQAWNRQERAAGGIIQQHPEDFHPRDTGGVRWLEHRRFFTTNPSLYRTTLLARGWPEGDQSEGHFTLDLIHAGFSFAYLGSGEEMVTHIGHTRAGVGY